MNIVNDKRSKEIVVCAHCILNQNAKLEGIAGWPGMINSIVDIIKDSGAGILQMPCPEILYEGIRRFDKSVEQYNCPAFINLSKTIVNEVVDQIENYISCGYEVKAILAIDGSPSCGYNLTQSAPEWRGLVANQKWKKVRYIKKPGIMMGIMAKELQKRKIKTPIIGVPEIPELGSLTSTTEKLKNLLGE